MAEPAAVAGETDKRMRKPKKGKLKLKSKRGAVKRFKLTATGKVKRGHAFKRHILTKKNAGRKRGLRKSTLVSDGGDAVGAPHASRVESSVRARLRARCDCWGAVVRPGRRHRL